ncbi:MAG: aldo/keto reductase [Pirellulaceae bacterium]
MSNGSDPSTPAPGSLKSLNSSETEPWLRELGNSGLRVSAIGFGCWPIAGVSTLGTNEKDSLATIHAAIDHDINFIDTAYSYGYDGEADRLLVQVLRERRSEVVVASKVGQAFDSNRQRVVCGRPEVLLEHAQQSIERLEVEQLDILYLHCPDPDVPLQESAAAIAEALNQGIAKCAGVSNVDLQELREFHTICPVSVVQPPFNMLQQSAVLEIRNYCRDQNIAIANYWALMKGLLAGGMQRDHNFDPNDKRLTYEIFQGKAWERAQDFLDTLRSIAQELQCTVSQLVLLWTVRQPGITSALCGAKRPEQIMETAKTKKLFDAGVAPDIWQAIEAAINAHNEDAADSRN